MPFKDVKEGEDGLVDKGGRGAVKRNEGLDVGGLTAGCGGHGEEGVDSENDGLKKGLGGGGLGEGGEVTRGEEDLEVLDDDSGLEGRGGSKKHEGKVRSCRRRCGEKRR
jgi:hypothetical protein